MQKDRHPKIDMIGRHIPEFPGYQAINYRETDRQLRHFLQRRLAEVRDRLADFVAGLPEGGAPRRNLGQLLRRLSDLRESLAPDLPQPQRPATPAPDHEEALLDFDLNLLDKSAALAAAVEGLDREGGGPAVQSLLAGLLDDLEALCAKRKKVLAGIVGTGE